MKLTIAQTGVPPQPLRDQWPGYPSMFETLFRAAGAAWDFRTVDVEAGELLTAPEAGEALLVTGSPKGVHEDHAFIKPLEQAVRLYAEAHAPVIGICFGHQLIAQAYGAEVGPSPMGWGVGVHTYTMVDDAPWAGGLARVACAVSHQDQVHSLPEGFRRVAGSAFTPFGVLAHKTLPILTFQMHPEFEHRFAGALMTVRSDRIPADRADLGQATLRHPSDRMGIARGIKQFIEEHVASA